MSDLQHPDRQPHRIVPDQNHGLERPDLDFGNRQHMRSAMIAGGFPALGSPSAPLRVVGVALLCSVSWLAGRC